jgi:hypothetical protein
MKSTLNFFPTNISIIDIYCTKIILDPSNIQCLQYCVFKFPKLLHEKHFRRRHVFIVHYFKCHQVYKNKLLTGCYIG